MVLDISGLSPTRRGKFFSGFTLIELLVVIFIMILLASIGATAALSVRKRGRDGAIQASLSQVRIEATLIKNKTEPSSYETLCCDIPACDADTLNETTYPDTLGVIEIEVRKYIPPTYNPSDYPECYADADHYCVQFPLNMGGFYCLDSTGYAGTMTTTNCTSANSNPSCQ